MLNAVAGLIPAGQRDLNPDLNAIQALVARREDETWRICNSRTRPLSSTAGPKPPKHSRTNFARSSELAPPPRRLPVAEL
jgi:hypothetical protein